MTTDLTRVFSGLLTALISVFLFSFPTGKVVAQCLTPELAMLNSCIEHDNPNGSGLPVESEILILRSGLIELRVDEVGFDLPFNGFGGPNADIGFDIDGSFLGCNYKEPTVTQLPGCPGAIPLGPNDVIPPNGFVVLFVNGTTVTADVLGTDFSNICSDGEQVYILQSACERTAGAFANGPGGNDPIRTISIASPCGLRGFSYNTQEINPNEGTYYLVGPNESGNLDCDIPTIPVTCPAIDTVFSFCGTGGMIDPPVSTDVFREIYPGSVLLVSFHRSIAEAETNMNSLDEYGGPTDAPDTLWARIIYGENLCSVVGRLVLRFPDNAGQTMVPAEPLRGCDPTGSGMGVFNLKLLDAEIGGGQPVTYYLDAGATNAIDDPDSYEGPPTTIFAVAGLGSCRANVVPIQLELIPGPSTLATVTPTSCPENEDGTISLATTGFGPFSYDWRTGEFDGMVNLTGLAARQYRVTVTDRYGCQEERRPRVLRGDALGISCSLVRAASEAGASNGAARVTFNNGAAPYQLTYSGEAAGTMEVSGAVFDLDNLAPGSYTFTATDANGCSSESCTVEVPASDPLELMCRVLNNSNGTVLGTIEVSITGGTEPLDISIIGNSDGVTNTLPATTSGVHLFQNLTAQTYTISVRDANNIVRSCTQTIVTVTCPLTITDVDFLTSDCSGTDNTVITLSIAGAQGTVSTIWSGPNGVETFNGQQEAGPLPPGIYFVNVSDQSGCTPLTEGPIMVTNPGDPTYSTDGNFTTTPCLNDGTIEVSIISGGTAPYEVVLFDPDTDAELDRVTGLASGTTTIFNNLIGGDGSINYGVFIVDASGCESTRTLLPIVGTPQADLTLPPADQVVTLPSCAGDSDATLMVSAEGGTDPYNYRWIDYPGIGSVPALPDGDSQTGLLAGTYTIEITDVNGCLDTATTVVPNRSLPTIACGATTPDGGAGTGTAEVVLAGGSPSYSVVVTGNGMNLSFPNLAAGMNTLTGLAGGNYLAIVTDANGCISDPCVISIIEVSCTLGVTATIDSLSCSGELNGSITLTPSGGDGNYSFNWADPALVDESMVMIPDTGNYQVTIFDGSGCALDTFFRVDAIDNAPELTLGLPFGSDVCSPDSIGIPFTVNGVSPLSLTYQLRYTADGIQVPGGIVPQGATDTIWIAFNNTTGTGAEVIVGLLQDANCQISYADTFNILIARPDTIRRNEDICQTGNALIGGRVFTAQMPSDTFEVDEGGLCPVRYEVDLNFEEGAASDTIQRFETTCPMAEVLIGGQTFTAAFPSDTFIVANGTPCGVRYEVNIDFTSEEASDTIQRFETVCQAGTVEIGGQLFTADSPTDTFVVDDGSQCGLRYEVALDFSLGEASDTIRRFETTCRSAPIDIGGRLFDMMTPSDTFYVADGSECGVRYEVDITFTEDTRIPDTVLVFNCPGTTYELNGEVFDANRPEGEVGYPVAGQCDSIVYIRLDIPDTNLGSFSDGACVGDTIFYEDRFFTADNTGGIVTLPGMAANGCDSLVVVTTSFRRTGDLRMFGDFEVCPGEPIDLRFSYDGPGGINARIADDQGNVTDLGSVRDGTRFRITPAQSTTYSLISADVGGCLGTFMGSSIVVVNDLDISAAVDIDPGNFCRDTLGRASVEVDGGSEPYTIVWSNGPEEAVNRNLLAGTYRVSVTDDLGCMLTDSVTLNPQFPLTARLTGLPPICPGESGRVQIDTIFGGGGFYEISIDGQFFLPIEDVNELDLVPGRLYRARIQDAADCRLNVDFFVPFPEAAVANLPTDTLIFLGDSLLLAPGIDVPLDTVWWSAAPGLRSPNTLTTVVMPLRSTTYTLNIITAEGCNFMRVINVTVDERLPVYAPTAFSPNGDDVNEVFSLGLSDRVEELRTFQIFNRWGVMVHDGIDGWNGLLNGNRAEPAVYVYHAVLLLADGTERYVKGDFVLMR